MEKREAATTVARYRADPLYPRVARAVAAILAHGDVVAPVDVLVAMELLAPERLQDWRRGRVPYLERVIHSNLTRLSRLLRILQFHAVELDLVPSVTVYKRWGKGPKQLLRFTKTGDPRVEEAYARHFVRRAEGALRRMKRGDLLIIAERATELLPRAKLQEVFGDRLRLDALTKTAQGRVGLLQEVRKFHDASLRGDYYESFDVDSKNFMQQSEGTEAFIAEFDRLVRKCIRAAEKGPRAPVRAAFELLFALLRHIDECHDDVIFFADECGSWQVGGNWRAVFPAYFRCLAETAPPEEFAREVHRAIQDFAEFERPRHLTAARRVASVEQKAALRSLTSRASPAGRAPSPPP